MFVLGHTGIGSRLASPWARGLPYAWLLAGTLLPDLIDKPLYYGASWMTGRIGAELGLISGTRTVGHTALFLLLLTALAWTRRSRTLAALALGTATHLLLDNLSDRALGATESSALQALVFPLLGASFGAIPFGSPQAHLHSLLNPFTGLTEVLGGALLSWDAWKRRHESEIIGSLRQAVSRLRRRRAHWRRPTQAP